MRPHPRYKRHTRNTSIREVGVGFRFDTHRSRGPVGALQLSLQG